MSGCSNPACQCRTAVIDTDGSGDGGTAANGHGLSRFDRIDAALVSAGFLPRQPGVSQYVWDLMEHAAVVKHGQGVSSDELASFTECLASLAQSRIKGVGHEQYDVAGEQEFESRSPAETAEYVLEELADGMAYMAMSAIKVLAILRAAQGV